MARKRKKPQALKFNVITESALKILAEIDEVSYNQYIEDVLEKRIEKAAKVLMDEKGVDIYAMAQKRCEADESYSKYM